MILCSVTQFGSLYTELYFNVANSISVSLPFSAIYCLIFSPAYVFDALISYLRCCESDSNAHIDSGGAECTGFSWERDENENEDDIDDLPSITPSAGDSESTDEDSNLSNSRGRKHTFFQVSDRWLYANYYHY